MDKSSIAKDWMIQKNDKVFDVLLDDNVLYILRKSEKNLFDLGWYYNSKMFSIWIDKFLGVGVCSYQRESE